MIKEKKNKTLIGRVIKINKNKSILVSLNKTKKHCIYKKIIKYNTKIKVHDEKNISNINDLVMIKYFRPISKTKSWILFQIINK